MQGARIDAWIIAAVIAGFCPASAHSQDYPSRPIRIISAEPGGSGDRLTRMVVPGLTSRLGQQVIVDNRGGASGIIAVETVVKAPADGYTLLSYGSIWILPLLRDDLSYDVLKDLAPITPKATSPNVLVVHPSLPVKSVKDLIALSKARSGEISYGTGGMGSSSHLTAELFKSMAGIRITGVPYKGFGQALTALVGGEVQMAFGSAGSAAPLVKSGRLRALAVTSAKPTPLAPDLPTIAATLPGYESVYMLGVFAPARTPPAVINRLNQEIIRVLQTAEIKERFFNAGVDVVGSTPQELRSAMESEMAKLGKVIRDAGIRLN